MDVKTSVNGMSEAIITAMSEYAGETAEEVKTAAKKAAQECKKDIQANSPKKTGDYKKGWKVKKNSENSTSVSYTVHNATDYQLTHLLEKGHAKASGGRVAAIPHIGPAEETANEKMLKLCKEAASK